MTTTLGMLNIKMVSVAFMKLFLSNKQISVHRVDNNFCKCHSKLINN